MATADTPFDRLKSALGVREDQEVAAALGMSPAAFSDRKRRGAFPRDKVLALVATRPEAQLDVGYILTGHSQLDRARSFAAHAAPAALHLSTHRAQEPPMTWPDGKPPHGKAEVELIANWRACGKADRETVSALAARLAKP